MNAPGVSDLYLVSLDRGPTWCSQGEGGFLIILDPQPQAFRTALMHSAIEQSILAASAQIADPLCSLMTFTNCPDGPPYRTALLYLYRGKTTVACQDGPYSRLGKEARLYRRANKTFSLGYNEAFFLTGPATGASLWRLFRAEIDVFDQWVLTLSPVLFSSKFPEADFSSVTTAFLVKEVSDQYADLARAYTVHSYREVVTKAKNIVEALIADKLGRTKESRDLYEDLRLIRRFLDDKQSRELCGWTDIEYHLANKIRLVHGQTHATAPAKTGRALRPEFALSTVEDLVELLYLWGYCK